MFPRAPDQNRANFSAKPSPYRAPWPESGLLRKVSPSTQTCTESWRIFALLCRICTTSQWKCCVIHDRLSFAVLLRSTATARRFTRGVWAQVSAALFCHCAASKSARMSQKERPTFYVQELNKTQWEVPERYQQLCPVGSGAYGSVW